MMSKIYEEPIRSFMDDNGLNQKEFAKLVGMAPSTLSEMLTGYAYPTKETLESISQKTGIVFEEWPEPMETVPVEQAAYELNMTPQCLKDAIRHHDFEYQFGVKPTNTSRYIIWRSKLDRFKKM